MNPARPAPAGMAVTAGRCTRDATRGDRTPDARVATCAAPGPCRDSVLGALLALRSDALQQPGQPIPGLLRARPELQQRSPPPAGSLVEKALHERLSTLFQQDPTLDDRAEPPRPPYGSEPRGRAVFSAWVAPEDRRAYAVALDAALHDPRAVARFDKRFSHAASTLNGVALAGGTAGLEGAGSELDFEEPELSLPDGPDPEHPTRVAAGVVLLEPSPPGHPPRLWLCEPSGHFADVEHSFPKGGVEGLVGNAPVSKATLRATALRELYEETGLRGRLTGFLQDFQTRSGTARFYFGERIGGDPAHAGEETYRVLLAPLEDARRLLNQGTAKAVLTAAQARIMRARPETKMHPISDRAPAGGSPLTTSPSGARGTAEIPANALERHDAPLGSGSVSRPSPATPLVGADGLSSANTARVEPRVPFSEREARAASRVLAALEPALDARGAPAVPEEMSSFVRDAVTWKVYGTKDSDRSLRVDGLVTNGGIIPFAVPASPGAPVASGRPPARVLTHVVVPQKPMDHADRIRLRALNQASQGQLHEKLVYTQFGGAARAPGLDVAVQLSRIRGDLTPKAALSLATGILRLFSLPFLADRHDLQARVLEDICALDGRTAAPSRAEMFRGKHPDSSKFAKEDGEILSEYVVVQLSSATMRDLEEAARRHDDVAPLEVGTRDAPTEVNREAKADIKKFEEHFANKFEAPPAEEMGRLRFAFAKMVENILPEVIDGARDLDASAPSRLALDPERMRADSGRDFPKCPLAREDSAPTKLATAEKESMLRVHALDRPDDRNMGNPRFKFGLRRSIRESARLSLEPIWTRGGSTGRNPFSWHAISPATARGLSDDLGLRAWAEGPGRAIAGDLDAELFSHAFENFAERYPKFLMDFTVDLLRDEPDLAERVRSEGARAHQVRIGEVTAAAVRGRPVASEHAPFAAALAKAFSDRGIHDVRSLEGAMIAFSAEREPGRYGDRIPAMFELSSQLHQELVLRWLKADPKHLDQLLDHVAQTAEAALGARIDAALEKVRSFVPAEVSNLLEHEAKAIAHEVCGLWKDKDAHDASIKAHLSTLREPLAALRAHVEAAGRPAEQFYGLAHQLLFSVDAPSLTKVSHPTVPSPATVETKAVIDAFLAGKSLEGSGLLRRVKDPERKGTTEPMSMGDVLLKYVKKHQTLVGRTEAMRGRVERAHLEDEGFLHHETTAGVRGFAYWSPSLPAAEQFERHLQGNTGEYPSDYSQFSDLFINAGLYLTADSAPVTATAFGATNATAAKSVTRSVATSYEYAARLLWGGSKNVAIIKLVQPTTAPASSEYLVAGENNWDDEDPVLSIGPERAVFSALFLPPEGQKHTDGGEIALSSVVWHAGAREFGVRIPRVTMEQKRLIEAAVEFENRRARGEPGPVSFPVLGGEARTRHRTALSELRSRATFETTLSPEQKRPLAEFAQKNRARMADFLRAPEGEAARAERLAWEASQIALRTHIAIIEPDPTLSGGLNLRFVAPARSPV